MDGSWIGMNGKNYIDYLAPRWKRAARIYLYHQDSVEPIRYEDFMQKRGDRRPCFPPRNAEERNRGKSGPANPTPWSVTGYGVGLLLRRAEPGPNKKLVVWRKCSASAARYDRTLGKSWNVQAP